MIAVSAFLLILGVGTPADGERDRLPSPLTLAGVRDYARVHRAEIEAARARAQAATQRPAAVSALEDPVLTPSLNHLPFSLRGADFSFTVEQRFALSGVLGHRRQAAEANARREAAEVSRTALDVELEASRAYFMLHERRQMRQVLEAQRALAKQFVATTGTRYSGGRGGQAEVIRAETEAARLEGAITALAAEARSAEAMLNAALNRPADAAVPPLQTTVPLEMPPESTAAREATLQARPELAAAVAEVQRADAEISATRAMYAPMAMVRTGPGYTMSDGAGWMLMFGISVPIWIGRNRAGIAEAEAIARMSRADLEAMKRMIEGEVEIARQAVLAARARYLSLRDDVVPRAEQTIAPSLAAYAAGTLPLVSVLDAARALWQAQAERVMAETELGWAWARFARARGKGVP